MTECGIDLDEGKTDFALHGGLVCLTDIRRKKIADRTFRIFEEKFVNAYLLMGDDKALWIDTGTGSGICQRGFSL